MLKIEHLTKQYGDKKAVDDWKLMDDIRTEHITQLTKEEWEGYLLRNIAGFV